MLVGLTGMGVTVGYGACELLRYTGLKSILPRPLVKYEKWDFVVELILHFSSRNVTWLISSWTFLVKRVLVRALVSCTMASVYCSVRE